MQHSPIKFQTFLCLPFFILILYLSSHLLFFLPPLSPFLCHLFLFLYFSLFSSSSSSHFFFLSLQAAYLVGVSDPNSQAGHQGLVDPIQFAKANQAIQMACQNLVDPDSSPSQVPNHRNRVPKQVDGGLCPLVLNLNCQLIIVFKHEAECGFWI